MSWHYSLELVEDYLDLAYLAGDQSVRLSTTSIEEMSLFRDKEITSLARSRSGTTLKHSTGDLGIDAWMLCQLDSRANHTQEQDNREEKTIQEICGPIPYELSMKYIPDSASWKTCLNSSLLITLGQSSKTWPRAGILLGTELYRLTTLEPTTYERGCGLLPSPRAADAEGGVASNVECREGSWSRVNAKGERYGVKLKDVVPLLPTPNARDYKDSQNQIKLRPDGKSRTDQLPRRMYAEGYGGKVNPEWVEWVMGMPIGWTGLKPLETHRFREWLELLGCYLEENKNG